MYYNAIGEAMAMSNHNTNRNSVKFGHVVPGIRLCTNRLTEQQTCSRQCSTHIPNRNKYLPVCIQFLRHQVVFGGNVWEVPESS